MCFGGGGAQKQADATIYAANLQAKSDREVARATVQSMETQIAQKRAADLAAETIGKPQKGATVLLSPQSETGKIDPKTGKRKSIRSGFFSRKSGVTL